jgi:3-deoxy-manno-octulosonate cytidylyltransferase (CMP-KDO synthetase)
VVNIQGDEPFIQPEQIKALMDCFPTEIATLVHPFSKEDTWEDLQNPNYVKVAIAHADTVGSSTIGRALYFSRSVVPYMRSVDKDQWLKQGTFYRHIGMYAYRADILEKITSLSPTVLEQTESLEQLRWLEHGLTIHVGLSHHTSIGIDTPEDLQEAIQYLQSASL